ncbi:hypothetical protein HDU99_001363, partial [Rhizoclosmatium hyalinum]
VSDGQLITRFTQKTQNSWKPQWAPNESFFARLSSDSDVLFYNPTGQANVSGTLPSAGKIPGDKLSGFSISGNKAGKVFAAVFSKEKNGVPGNIKLYDLEKALTESGAVCVATRSLFNADSVDFLWNADGEHKPRSL